MRSPLSRGASSFLEPAPRPSNAREFLAEFAMSTSAHGIPRVGSARSCLGRLIWSAICVACVSMFTYQMYWVVDKYLRNDKIVNIELAFEKVPFPAVTMCNVNAYKNSLLGEVDGLARSMGAFASAMGKSKKRPTRSRSPPPHHELLKRQLDADFALDRDVRRANNPQFKPALAHCRCDPAKPKQDCLPIEYSKPPSNESSCICNYDRLQNNAWPCYSIDTWEHDLCTQCSQNGYCVPTKFTSAQENAVKEPCICQTITNYCIRLLDGGAMLNLWELMTTTTTTTTVAPSSTTEDAQFLDAMGYEGVTDEVALVTKAKENLVFTMAGLPIQQRIALSYSKEEFVWKCSFNGQQCDIEKDFKLHVDPFYGNCYTFNYDRLSAKRATRAGPTFGLRVFLYIDASDFMATTEAKGVRIAVHNQTEVPFPDTFGFSAPTGFISSFGIKLKQMSRLPAPYGDCVKDASTEANIYTGYDYSPEGCYRSCFQRQLIRECGCGDPRFPLPPGARHCSGDNKESRACLEERMLAGATTSTDCHCGQPCDQSVFSVAFSAAKWPSGASKPSDCNLTLPECIELFRENAAMVEIFFEQLNYEALRESEAYGIVNLLADCGGQLGLWMGISVITCAELFVLVWDIFLFLFRQLQANPDKRQREEDLKKAEEEMGLKRGGKQSPFPSTFADDETRQFTL